MQMIASPLIPKFEGYIDGRWSGANSGECFSVINPATGECLAEMPLMGTSECNSAIDAAMRATQSTPSLEERQGWLKEIGDRLLINKQEFGRIITLEHGKPLREGIGEVEYAAAFFHYFSVQLDRLRPHELDQHKHGCRWQVHLRPAGVVGAIASWNFPLAMLAKKTAPALGAGCGVVAKPPSLTPLSALALTHIVEQSGVPRGRFNIVVGKPQPIGQVFCSHPDVRVISFTGSTEVGKQLASAAAPFLKRLALELGGNAPFLVFPDADLKAAADGLICNKFRAGGQTCVCANRVFVHRETSDEFVGLVAERVRRLRVGNGIDPTTDIGPLINRAGFDKVADHVQDALARGADRIVGEDTIRPDDDWGYYYPPTLLVNVRPDMRVCCEETFGPVIAVSVFDDEDEVIREANSTEYGLAAYLFTRNSDRAQRFARMLRFGHVGLNSGTGPTPEAPFGGMKQSGYGREGGLEGLLEFCEPQVVANGQCD
jgi:succinate-semialdehyde dehydrogenase/glutarate-semialdehyde dehydrogenase